MKTPLFIDTFISFQKYFLHSTYIKKRKEYLTHDSHKATLVVHFLAGWTFLLLELSLNPSVAKGLVNIS